MSSWNYRVVKTIDSTGAVSYGIHEVYYNDERMPQSFTVDPVPCYGDTPSELIAELERMRAALSAPVLTEADFPKEISNEQ